MTKEQRGRIFAARVLLTRHWSGREIESGFAAETIVIALKGLSAVERSEVGISFQ